MELGPADSNGIYVSGRAFAVASASNRIVLGISSFGLRDNLTAGGIKLHRVLAVVNVVVSALSRLSISSFCDSLLAP